MFPIKYIAFNKQCFSLGKFSIVPIRFEDRLEIMKWRNEQMYHLRQQELLTLENQDKYFNEIVSHLFNQAQPNQILFSYIEDNQCIGYGGLVHINWVKKTAEISFIMNTELESTKFEVHWSNFLKLIEQLAFEELGLKTIFTYAYDLRPWLYPVLEKNRFQLKKRLHNFIDIEGELKDVLIHEKNNRNITLRKATKQDVDLLFEWANDELVRKQSFESKPIIFEEHVAWFNEKLEDKNSVFHIINIENQPFSLVRYSISTDETTIGLLLDKNFRGQGLASMALRISCKQYFENNDQPIFAYIKKDNIASVKSFEKAGFSYYKEDKIKEISSFVYQLKKHG